MSLQTTPQLLGLVDPAETLAYLTATTHGLDQEAEVLGESLKTRLDKVCVWVGGWVSGLVHVGRRRIDVTVCWTQECVMKYQIRLDGDGGHKTVCTSD